MLARCLRLYSIRTAFILSTLAGGSFACSAQSNPLPPWTEGPIKSTIEKFVSDVTKAGSPDFVSPEDRIAVFDNDGTLMVEQPCNINLQFAIDQIRSLMPQHPEWHDQQPFKSVLEDDRAYLSNLGQADTLKLFLAAYSGTDEPSFEQHAAGWLKTARNSKFDMTYMRLIYRPQIELIDFLRHSGFKVFVVSGGEVDFLRGFAKSAYGIEAEQVIGTSVRYGFSNSGGQATLQRLPQVGSLDDGPGKPANIQLHIGKTPILTFGNADGDEPMLAMSASNTKPHLELVLHHDDAAREFAYDRHAQPWAKLDKLLDEAKDRHWLIVSMKNDFKAVFAASPMP
jgi:phosphoserine phosphatase